jgi:hypothetical protein
MVIQIRAASSTSASWRLTGTVASPKRGKKKKEGKVNVQFLKRYT